MSTGIVSNGDNFIKLYFPAGIDERKPDTLYALRVCFVGGIVRLIPCKNTIKDYVLVY